MSVLFAFARTRGVATASAPRSFLVLKRFLVPKQVSAPFLSSVLFFTIAATAVAVPAPARQRAAAIPDEVADQTIEDQIVVSAERLPVGKETVGSSVTVIDEQEIERRGSLTVVDLLRTVPGVEITQTGAAGKAASVRIRGGDASQALVLIDGVRVNSPTTGDFDFANLRTDAIERIEILRGPQATYGSEAVTGVISIFTKRGDLGLHSNLEGEVGNLGLSHLRGSVDGRRGNFDYSLAASQLHTDGVSHVSGPSNNETDAYENQTMSGRFGFGFENDGRIELTLRAFDGNTELDGFRTDDPNAEQTTRSLIAVSRIDLPLTQRWRQRFEAGVHASDLEGDDPDTFFNNYRIKTRTQHLYAQSDFELGSRDTLTFGYTREERHAENTGSFDENAIIDSAFVQNRFSFGVDSRGQNRVHLSTAIRYDDHSVFGDETTWRVTAAIRAASESLVHGSVGTAFRAPDFNELFFPGAGDPTLRPETNTGWDLGLEQRFLKRRLTLDLTYFSNDFENLIDFDLNRFQFANVVEAESSGVEASLHLEATSKVRLRLNHTYNDTRDRRTGAALARRPRNRTSLGVDFDPKSSIRGNLTVVAVRDRVESNGRAMDDYERVDLMVRFRAERQVQPYVRAENLLDADYEEVPGFTTPGRLVAVGLRYRR